MNWKFSELYYIPGHPLLYEVSTLSGIVWPFYFDKKTHERWGMYPSDIDKAELFRKAVVKWTFKK